MGTLRSIQTAADYIEANLATSLFLPHQGAKEVVKQLCKQTIMPT